MALVDSLLTAIVRADGDALVMHVGEKPYVVASAGPIDLSTQALNLEAMAGMVSQLLPAELQRALSEFGAVEHELASNPATHRDRFTVVIARGGDDVWIEIRRHRRGLAVAAESPAPSAAEPVPAPVPAALAPEPMPVPVPVSVPVPVPVLSAPVPGPVAVPQPVSVPEPIAAVRFEPVAEVVLEAVVKAAPEPVAVPIPEPIAETVPEPIAEPEPMPVMAEPVATRAPEPLRDPEPLRVPEPMVPSPVVEPTYAALPGPVIVPPPSPPPPEVAPLAAVLPMTRTLRIDVPPRAAAGRSGIERLLSIAAARGAGALYLTSQAPPFLRLDDDVRMLEGEPALSSTDVESAVLELMPEATRDALRRGDPTEWVSDLADIGRVRCSTFRDYRGPGALFQLIAVRPVSAEQLGLGREIQALANEAEGLVVVASPRGAGKSTLAGAFVDLINRQRSNYVITLERQIRMVHDNRSALISQREVRGTAEQVVTVARGALRENPDVLVIEELPSAEMFQLALDAAGSGLLVLITVTAGSTTAALSRLLDLFPPERRKAVQALLSERLRGAIAQVLLRKAGGGRLPARELLQMTAAVAGVIADGQLSDLPLAIESGRKHGMSPLNDALLGFVRTGAVDVREAYRKADDREGLLIALKREGIDTSLVERLA